MLRNTDGRLTDKRGSRQAAPPVAGQLSSRAGICKGH